MRWIALVALVACGGRREPGADPARAGEPTAGSSPTEETPAPEQARTFGSAPLYGGTLIADPGSDLVFASDPEGDRVIAVDAATGDVVWVRAFEAGTRPFRLALAGDAVFVTLRDAAALARIDVATSDAVRLPTCLEPRGVAWDAASGELFVACASGEVEVRDAAGVLQRSVHVDTDLRDVVPTPEGLFVSRFRAAEVLTLDRGTLAVTARRQPPLSTLPRGDQVVGRVGWQLVPGIDDDVVLVHQLHQTTSIALESGDSGDTGGGGFGSSYGGSDGCGVVTAAMSRFPVDGSAPQTAPAIGGATLPVAVTAVPHGYVLAAAGSDTLLDFHASLFDLPAGKCLALDALPAETNAGGQIVAGVRSGGGRSVVATQAPFTLQVDQLYVDVPKSDAEDQASPVALFHRATPSGLACASCHPEGQDDGHVWLFDGMGPRRTQNLAIGLTDTAPYHWDGAFRAPHALLDDVLVGRMGGGGVSRAEAQDLFAWLDHVRPARVTPSGDADAIARGEALFGASGCTACHAGAALTTAGNQDVGREEPLQTPSLVGVGARGPWMHDGCAATLADRFLDPSCGGIHHGDPVDAADVPDLVAYLETL